MILIDAYPHLVSASDTLHVHRRIQVPMQPIHIAHAMLNMVAGGWFCNKRVMWYAGQFVLLGGWRGGGRGNAKRSHRQDFCDNVKKHMHALRNLGIEPKPKHHQLLHMVTLLQDSGAPHTWACWRDESENQDLKRLALKTHRMVWHKRLLSSHRVGFGVRKLDRKRNRVE